MDQDTLRRLVAELLRANKEVNLTSIRDPNEAWIKHVLDSLQGLETPHFERKIQCVDVGAGAGFPGLPLAITRPETRWTFIESTGKKCRFIEAMSQEFDLGARVLPERAEETGHKVEWRNRFHVATARAVGSLSEVCELCLPLVRLGGHIVLWRGGAAEQEAHDKQKVLAELGGKVQAVMPYNLPGHDTRYHLMVVEKVAATPKEYPRRVGVPKKEPL